MSAMGGRCNSFANVATRQIVGTCGRQPVRGMLGPVLILAVALGLTLGLTPALAEDETLYLADRSEASFYGQSHALVIGVGEYDHYKVLKGVEKDARAIQAALRDAGFDNVVSHYGQRLSGADMRAIIEEFVDRHGYEENSRILIWMAGHGLTVDGEGYLLGADAPLLKQASTTIDQDLKTFFKGSVPMRLFGIHLRQMRARHVMLVIDSCFSGTIFQNTRSGSAVPLGTSREMLSPTRQIITSGMEGQEVDDEGPFADSFIRAIQGKSVDGETAHRPGQSYLTGTELGMFLYKTARTPQQTPQFGKLPSTKITEAQDRFMFRTEQDSYEHGEFFFRVPGAAGPAAAEAPPTAEPAASRPAAIVWMPLAEGTRIANRTPDPIPVFRSPPPEIGGKVADLRAGEQYPPVGVLVPMEQAEIDGARWVRFSSNGNDRYLPAGTVTIERP